MPGSVELCVLIFSNSTVAGTGDLSGSRVTLSAYLLALLCPLHVPQPAYKKQLFLPFLCSTVWGAHFVDVLERILKVTAPGWQCPLPGTAFFSTLSLIFSLNFSPSVLGLWVYVPSLRSSLEYLIPIPNKLPKYDSLPPSSVKLMVMTIYELINLFWK